MLYHEEEIIFSNYTIIPKLTRVKFFILFSFSKKKKKKANSRTFTLKKINSTTFSWDDTNLLYLNQSSELEFSLEYKVTSKLIKRAYRTIEIESNLKHTTTLKFKAVETWFTQNKKII